MRKFVITYFAASVVAISFLLTSFSLAAQTEPSKETPASVPDLLVKANEAHAKKDYVAFRDAMMKINEMRPYNGEYMYQLVIAHALLDEKTPAYELMVKMQQQGLAYDFSKTESTKNIRSTEVFTYINDLMVMAGDPVGEAETAFTLLESMRLPETIAWDESRQKFLVGSVADGSIIAVSKDGQATELFKSNDENGMWAVLDIMVDAPRKTLWVTSTSIPKFSGFNTANKGRSALFEYNLETLKLVRSYPVPADGRPHALGSMVMSPNGDIFIADRALPIVFSKPANEQSLKAVMGFNKMISMRGVAMQPDGRVMYVADRELGILVADVEAGKAGKLAIPKSLNIGGIDGIYLWNNHLVIIQNGNQPQRVMRLQLDASGMQVTAVRPLAVAQPEFDLPSYGAIVGNELFFFASSQWDVGKGDAKPVKVLRTAVDSNKDLEPPELQRYLRQRGEKQGPR